MAAEPRFDGRQQRIRCLTSGYMGLFAEIPTGDTPSRRFALGNPLVFGVVRWPLGAVGG